MPGRLDSAWRGLEEVDGLAATKRHWETACGQPLFRCVVPFLSPTGDRADWIPDPTDRQRQMRVIPASRRRGGGFIAISEEEPRSPDVPLASGDLEVYRLDLPRFGRRIAEALGFRVTRPAPVLAPNLARLPMMPTHGLELVLALPCREDDLPRALDLLRARISGRFALITPTNHTVSPHIRSAIDEGSFQHATLGELLAVAEDGSVTMLWDPAECFSPAEGVQTGPPYLTWPFDRPPTANWGHVTIGLRSPDTLRIQFGESVREFVARDIVGFVKNTPGQHVTEAWDLLRRLAEANGTLPTETGKQEQGKLRGSRKALADLLRRFFGINSLPFADNRRAKVWAAHFGISVID